MPRTAPYGNLARRALVALQAEIERRQAALAAAGCNDLDDYLRRRRLGEPLEPVPHLILVVDEFAELKTERPDFIHQLVVPPASAATSAST